MGGAAALTPTRKTRERPRTIRTVRVRLRVGAEDFGERVFPASYRVVDVVADLPELPVGINCVVIDDGFRYPQPLTSALRIAAHKRLFFTGLVPVKITDYHGRKIVRSAELPVLGLPLLELPIVAATATGIATTPEVIVDGKRLNVRRLQRAGVVEAGHDLQCPDP